MSKSQLAGACLPTDHDDTVNKENKMLYSPKSIANYFLDLANDSGEEISPMKLQKLVYYAHGWYAGYTGRPLIDESVKAWQYGPAIPSLYDEFKQFGAGSITGKATCFEGMELREVPHPEDVNLCKFLDNVWASYGRFTELRLSEMSHAPDGPWDQTWKAAAGIRGIDIPFEKIATYFKVAAEKAKDSEESSLIPQISNEAPIQAHNALVPVDCEAVRVSNESGLSQLD